MIITVDGIINELEKISRRLSGHNKRFLDAMFIFGAVSLAKDVEVSVIEAYKNKDFLALRRPIETWVALELINWARFGGLIPEYRKEYLKGIITAIYSPWEYRFLLIRANTEVETIEYCTKQEIKAIEETLKELEKGKK
jgi:hypothetical protein